MLDRGKLTTSQVAERWGEVQRLAPEYHWGWVELTRLYVAAGRQGDAMAAARNAVETAGDERPRSVSYAHLGDIERSAGNLAASRAHHYRALKIFKERAERNPDSAEALRDLIVTYAKFGQLTGEKQWWKKGLAVAKALHGEGRLAPRDHWMLDVLRERAGE